MLSGNRTVGLDIGADVDFEHGRDPRSISDELSHADGRGAARCRVYRLRATGQLDYLLANVPSPNGIVLDVAERVLFVAATRGNEGWRVPLQADGGVSKVGRFLTLSGTSGPDGLAAC